MLIINIKYYFCFFLFFVGNLFVIKKNDIDLMKKSSDVKFKCFVELGMNCIKR